MNHYNDWFDKSTNSSQQYPSQQYPSTCCHDNTASDTCDEQDVYTKVRINDIAHANELLFLEFDHNTLKVKLS